jgi:hypothetical protein
MPDGLSSNQNTNLGKFWRALQWKTLVYFTYAHLVYFTAIVNILWPFGIVCGHLVYFPPFWYVVNNWNLATLIQWIRQFTLKVALCWLPKRNGSDLTSNFVTLFF